MPEMAIWVTAAPAWRGLLNVRRRQWNHSCSFPRCPAKTTDNKKGRRIYR